MSAGVGPAGRRAVFVAALAIAALGGLSLSTWGGANAAGIVAPQVQATKSPSSPLIEKGEWAKVQLTIVGDTKQQPSPVPSAVVLAIDYSGSMQASDAYLQASAAAKDALALLVPGVDAVGVLRISSVADWLIPLAPLSAASIPSHQQTIDAQTAGGMTNYKEAFDKANQALAAYPAANKFVIFFSDGIPEPDTVAQQNYIYTHRYDPAASGIRYFTIAYGSSFAPILLQEMAESTGGVFFASGTAAGSLQAAFKSAVASGQTSLSAHAVEIVEIVNPKLKVRPESLTWSAVPPTVDPAKFQQQMSTAASTFPTTRKLAVPKLPELAQNQNFALTFDVTTDECLDGEDLDLTIDTPQSEVRWLAAGQAQTLAIPASKLGVRPCDVHLEKSYDPTTHIVTLTVRNDLPRTIEAVFVLEVTADGFRPAAPFTPAPELVDAANRQVRWGIYDVNKLSMPAGAEQKFAFRLSGETANAGPLPIDHTRAGVTWQTDRRLFAVPASSGAYTTLVADAQAGALSQAGADELNARMAVANFTFAVPKGTPVGKAPTSSGFDYVVAESSQSRELKLRVTPSEVIVYAWLQDSGRFPQVATPTGHIVPK